MSLRFLEALFCLEPLNSYLYFESLLNYQPNSLFKHPDLFICYKSNSGSWMTFLPTTHFTIEWIKPNFSSFQKIIIETQAFSSTQILADQFWAPLFDFISIKLFEASINYLTSNESNVIYTLYAVIMLIELCNLIENFANSLPQCEWMNPLLAQTC